MKKLLIVGAGILQVPAYLEAKKMGLFTAAVDYNLNAPAIKFADKYFNCSTINKEGLLKVAKDFCPDGIMTMATDMPMRAISYVCNKLGLNSISEDCAFLCTDKTAMIERFNQKNVPCPKYSIINHENEIEKISFLFSFPIIMKPADSSGSRGVHLINDIEEFKENFNYAKKYSLSGKVLLEEYMTGKEVSVETFVVDGEVHIIQITDKLTSGAPFFVEEGHNQPSQLDEKTKEKIRIVAKQACDAVNLTQGPAHIEIMVTQEGPKMIEMGARLGGDFITSHLVPLSTGVNMVKQTILSALKEKVDLKPKFNKASAVRFINSFGKIKEIQGVDEAKRIKGVIETGFFKGIGDITENVQSSSDRTGYVIVQEEDIEKAEQICSKAIKKIKILT